MSTPRYDVAVVGAGIVGLATALRLRQTGRSVVVLEAEASVAMHQTGHNSGVIHSGLYYRPGSLKARLAVAGRDETVAFCRRHDLPHRMGGQLVVAGEEAELPRLAELARRAWANGVECHELDAAGARRREPGVRALAALHVPGTGVGDFGLVAATLATLCTEAGGLLLTRHRVRRLVRRRADVVVRADSSGSSGGSAGGTELLARRVVACAGLHGDELARRGGTGGTDLGVRILPFRGEYARLRAPADGLVRELVYPVPDPELPFLGVHATRGVGGGVHVGPNAVLALAREGYDWRTVRPRELAGALAYPGLHRLARRWWRCGLDEVRGSLSKQAMAARVRRLLPEVRARDLAPAGAGVRAQAVRRDGTLVDDFLVISDGPVVHVLNAPSPAATAALPLGREIAARLTGERLAPAVSW